MVMKFFAPVFLLLAIGYSQAFPTLGWSGGIPQRGPGWSDAAVAASLYPTYANSYGGYGYAASAPFYAGSYSQSPNFPGYIPGLYGLGYLNLRN